MILADDVADPEGTLDVAVELETLMDEAVPEAVPEDADPVDDDGDIEEVGRGTVVKPLVLTGGAAVPRAVAVPELDLNDEDVENDDASEVGEEDDEVDEELLVLDNELLVFDDELVVLEDELAALDEREARDEELEVLDEELEDDDVSEDVVVLGSWPGFTGLPPLPVLLSAVDNVHSFTSCTNC